MLHFPRPRPVRGKHMYYVAREVLRVKNQKMVHMNFKFNRKILTFPPNSNFSQAPNLDFLEFKAGFGEVELILI